MTDSSPDIVAVRRLGWALGLSVVLHAALFVLVEERPGGSASLSGARSLEARIEAQSHAGVPPMPADADPSRDPQAAAPAPMTAPGRDPSAEPSERTQEQARPTAVDRNPAQDEGTAAPGIEMPFVRDPTYYAMAALDVPPRPLGPLDACYPQGAIGKITYLLSINERGTVDEVVVDSVRPQGLFTGAAEQLCRRMKFTPATKDGRAVRARVRLVLDQPPS